MEELSITDLNRMMQAIQHECSIRIREIKLEALQEYNLLKSEIITSKEKQLSIEFKKKLKDIKKEQDKEESNINQNFKLKVNLLKENLMNTVVEELKKTVQERQITTFLLKQIVNKIKSGTFYAFCFERDEETVERILNESNITYEIRRLPEEALGGIILCSKDGKEIWDNTFETRINILLENNLDKISKEFFN